MADDEQLNGLIGSLLEASDSESVKAVYADWADRYDNDLNGYGYVAPQTGVALLQQVLSERHRTILDAGCGTGKVGALLGEAGYTNVYGSDFSPQMLDIAARRGCYIGLENMDFCQPLPCSDNVFDALISIGVYSSRFGAAFVDELIRVVKPAGYVVFTFRPQYFDQVWGVIGRQLQHNMIRQSSIQLKDYLLGQHAQAYYGVLQKSGTDRR